MKIAYSLSSIGNSGGIERVISTKANYFADVLCCEVHIIVASSKPKSLFFTFSDKIQFHYLDIILPNLKPWDLILGNSKTKTYKQVLESKLLEIKPNITISVFGRDASFLYKLKDGSTKILEFHFTKNYLTHLGNAMENDKFRFIRKYWLRLLLWREERTASHYDNIVLLTERDKMLWGGGEKFTVIPNPLSFKSDELSNLDSKTIVSMGRLVYPKGFQYLIRAFAKIHKQYPDWKIKIYGDGHDKELLQNEINTLSLQAKVLLETPKDDVKQIMQQASLFVLPTLYDGFGLVLTEAMECGVPCIAFDCECGPGEIITNKEDGFLVELRNIDELANKMNLLMSDETLRKTMGLKAKDNVKRFSIENIGSQCIQYYNI
ncbi:glycosyltransferase involved in cell wall biosynthesis [Dysgonomonadaceae bacterium PH5-43]|nr:glycosyltransferase involved in cell wall biosynthesis [Dysgonomonadaceae bacterium PH5-43]